MTLALLAELAAKSFLIAGATLALLALLKGRSAAERSWVAHAALIVLLVLPAASLMLPKLRLLPPQPAMTASAAPMVPAATTEATTPLVAVAPSLDPALVLQIVYALGAGLLLAGALLAVLRLSVLRHGATVVVEAEWLTALARAQRRMGVKYGAALLASNALSSPVSWGMMRPTILLNEKAVARPGDAEAIIAHELAHVARLDWAKLLIARIITALYWFNPFVWLLARECHQLREEAADDAVLCADVPSADYASLLVAAARHECRGALIAAHGVAPGKGSLHQRVTRVLDGTLRRVPARAAWAAGCLVGSLVVAGPLSALTLERATAPREEVAATSVAVTPPHGYPQTKPTSLTRSAQAAQMAAKVAPLPPQAAELRAKGAALDAQAAPAAVLAAKVAPLTARAAELEARTAALKATTARAAELSARLAPLSAQRAELAAKGAALRAQTPMPVAIPVVVAANPLPADFHQRVDDAINGRAKPDELNSLAHAGYTDRGEQLALNVVRVTPAYIAELASAGYPKLSVDDLVAFKALGITPAFIRSVQRPGEPKLTAKQLIEMRED